MRRLAGLAMMVAAVVGPTSARAQESERGDTLTLMDAVRRALDAQPRVDLARAVLDAARANRAEAQAAWWPHVSLDAGITHFEEPMLVTPLHGLGFLNPAEFLQNLPEFDATIVDATLAARWTLLEGGARAARSRAARAGARAAEAGLEGAEDATIAATVAAYARAVAAREILSAHDQRLEALDAERSRVEKALREGAAARVELARAGAALARARADRIAAAVNLEVAAGELARLAGLPDTGPALAARLALPRIEPPAAPPSGAASPAVARARWEADAARAAADAARAMWWPDVAAQGAFVERGAAGEPATYAGEWQVGLRLAWPVFTGGARKAQVDRAEAEAGQAEARARQAELDQADQVEQARAAFDRARTRETALAEAVEASVEVVRVERLALEVGAGVQAERLDAEADLLEARAAQIEARAATLAAAVELARATGALDLEWLANHLAGEDTR